MPFPNPWMLPQWRTTELLSARLEELGAGVKYGVPVTAFEQDERGVSVTLGAGADAERLCAEYLVGCDGGHSFVRKVLGVRFAGEALQSRVVVLADVEIDGLDRSRWHVWPFAQGCLLTLCPFPRTSWFQLAAPLSGRAAPPEMSEDGVREFIERRIGSYGIRVRRIGWMSLFRAQVRLVERYRVGRVLLAGDAAHVHPPAGGQGLNTGIQDAYNLGWKLAAVLRGAPSSLIDTYQAERLPIAASVLGISKRLTLNASVRRGSETQQLGLHYRGTPLAVDDTGRPGRVRSGDRAPDAPCVDEGGASRRLFEVFRGTHMTLLVFDGSAGSVTERVSTSGWAGVHVVRVLPQGKAPVAGAIVDVAGHARSSYGLEDASALVLVRPDGYIGYFGKPGSYARLDQYLSAVRHRNQLVPLAF